MSKLIIIGNGFDLAHKIPTSYNDFRKYLITKYPSAYKNKDRIIDKCTKKSRKPYIKAVIGLTFCK